MMMIHAIRTGSVAVTRRWRVGVGADEDARRLSHGRIRAHAAAVPTVHLAAHEAETAERLAERRHVPTRPEGVLA